MKVNFFSILLFLLCFCSSIAQTVKITGKVTDSIRKPLEYANVFAVPTDKDINISYAITNEKGNYILKLQKNKTYQVTTSFLGYVKQEVRFNISKDTTYNFVLKEDKNQLDEVTLTYTIPVKVKQDTITYNADSFKTGEERKLKDVLKKLPGIEVDRQGNVTANGKKIKKLLVEDKPFFGGNTKLGVNNIPADAIDKVQVLENYNDVAMLKGLQDSEDSVLNIKLKKDKKKFVFGDIEAGAGVENRYLLHPKLFYYSPKTSVNFIGDLNNQGVKSFTFKDYLDFEGGISKMLTDVKGYFSLYNSDFAKYLTNQDYISETNNFGAFSIRHSISNASDLSAYIISSKSNTDTQTDNQYLYLTGNTNLTENRKNTNTTDNFFTIGKLTLDYNPNVKTDYTFASFVKITESNSFGNINSITNTDSNYIKTKNNLKALNLKQSVSLNKDISKKHTATFDASFDFNYNKPKIDWQTNQSILQNLIPLQNAQVYQIFQDKKYQTGTLYAVAKDYWILHRFHHLYTSVGVYGNQSEYQTTDWQVLDDGLINNFNQAGFNNDFNYNFLDAFIKLEYKFKIGKATFKPATAFHKYYWTTKQYSVKKEHQKSLLLPEFTAKIKFRNSERFHFKYRLKTQFANTKMLADNYVLNGFNTVFKGNALLENNLYHDFSATYYKYNMFKGYHFNIGLNYTKRIQTVKNTVQLTGINQFNTLQMFYKPETTLSFNTGFSKRINKIKYKLNFNSSNNLFYQLVNNTTQKNRSISYGIKPSIKTFFKKLPNLEIGYENSINEYKTNTKTEFKQEKLFLFLDYDFLKDFIFNSDFSYIKYTDTNQNRNSFFNANAKLFYQKEDSPWGFELQTTNMFNAKYKQKNSISEFIILDTKTYILPRIFMFKVIYKL